VPVVAGGSFGGSFGAASGPTVSIYTCCFGGPAGLLAAGSP
jgi:hypothetical protein